MSLGGLTRDEATAALTRYVQDAAKSPITLTSGDNKWTLLPSDVGTEIDVKQAVTAAMAYTRKSNFFMDAVRRFKLYFGGSSLPLTGTIDTALMDDFLAHLAEQLDVPPVNSGLALTGGEIKIVDGRKGNVVDQVTLREQLKSLLFSLHSTELAIPMVVKDPAVQAEHSQEALAAAQTMVSAPVTLVNGDKDWTLTTEEIAAYMDFTAKDQNGVSVLVPYLSADKMKPFFDQIRAKVASAAVDATFASDGKKAWVVPAVPGRSLDAGATAAALTSAALQSTDRTAEVAVKDTEPKLTTAEAKAMGIKDKLASYTTEYVGTEDRQHNVKLTTSTPSPTICWRPVRSTTSTSRSDRGPRTAATGWPRDHRRGQAGGRPWRRHLPGLHHSLQRRLRAGLKINERWNHSLFINHYPPAETRRSPTAARICGS